MQKVARRLWIKIQEELSRKYLPINPAVKRVPVLNWGRIRQKKERDGLCLSYALPMIVGSGL